MKQEQTQADTSNRTAISRHGALATYRLSDAWLLAQFLVLWLALGALLLFQLNQRPLAKTEVDSILLAQSTFAETIDACVRAKEPPLFPLVCTSLGLDSLSDAKNVRYLSVFFGWLTFLPAFWLLRRATPLAAYSFLFTVIFATSPFWIQMSRLATEHSLFALTALFSTAFLFQAMENPRPHWWVGYTFFTVLMLYTDNLAPAVLVGQGAASLFRKHWTPERKTFGRLLILLLCWLICFDFYLAWLPVTLRTLWHATENGAEALGLPVLQNAALSTAYMIYMFMFGDSVHPWNALRALLLSLSTLVAGMFGLVRILEHHHRTLRSVFICGIFAYLVAMAAKMMVLHDVTPLTTPLRLAFLYPFFALAGAYGFGVMNKWLAIPLLSLVLVIHGYSLRNYYNEREYTNWAYAIPVEQTLGAIESFEEQDAVLVIERGSLGHFAFLYRGKLPILIVDPKELSPETLREKLSAYQRVLFLHPGGGREYEAVTQALQGKYQLARSLPYVTEDAVANEVKMFLAGRPIPRSKYYLDVYEKGGLRSSLD